MAWLILPILVLLFFALLGWRIWTGRRKSGYLALIEFWVYSDVQRLPPTAALMDAVVSKNPHNRIGRPSISAREGIMFSDLRLHLAVAKREKNLFAFRPDLFEQHAVPDADVLEQLASCHTLATIRFASQVPLQDKAHLQFITHLADTVARLTRARLLFDTVSERFWLPSQLSEELQRDNNAERPDLHLRVVWRRESEGFRAATLGLRKVGRPELVTAVQEPDEEVLVNAVIERAATRLFIDSAAQLPLEIVQHGDTFVVSEDGAHEDGTLVKIVRRQSQ